MGWRDVFLPQLIFPPTCVNLLSMGFSALECMDDLVKVGVPEPHAKAIAYKLQDFRDSELATKGDLKIALKELEYKLTIRMGIIAAGQVALIAALVKLL